MTGTCPTCGQQFSRGPHAVYCSRKCKARASELRRRARHPDRDRDRYHRESDRRREYAREYSRANLSVGVVRRRNRKDRKRGNPGFAPFSPAEWQAVVRRWGGCAYCGSPGPVQIDHVVPLARGGRHSIGNVLPACAGCNISKHAALLAEWRYLRGGGCNLIPK